MKHVLLLLLASPALAIPANTTLTLANDPPYNVLNITISGPDITTDTTTSTLTGNVDAAFNINNTTGGTTEFTLSNGNISATDFSLAGNVLFFGSPIGPYTASATGLAATLFTTLPPGSIDSLTGAFAASQHKLSINQGTVTGSGVGQNFLETFSPGSPFEGVGSGFGSVSITPTTSNSLYQNYNIEVILPGISISDAITIGTGPSVTATITGTGDIKAVGTLQVPLSEYLSWTISNGIPGAPGQDDANNDGIPNALAWAMDLNAFSNAAASRPEVSATHGFKFEIPGTTVAEIRLQRSSTLAGWSDVPGSRISTAANPLPIGSFGTITVTPSGDPVEFFRLKVEE